MTNNSHCEMKRRSPSLECRDHVLYGAVKAELKSAKAFKRERRKNPEEAGPMAQ